MIIIVISISVYNPRPVPAVRLAPLLKINSNITTKNDIIMIIIIIMLILMLILIIIIIIII